MFIINKKITLDEALCICDSVDIPDESYVGIYEVAIAVDSLLSPYGWSLKTIIEEIVNNE